MRKMITSYKKLKFFLTTILLGVIVSFSSSGQCPPSTSIVESYSQLTICAPARVNWNIAYEQTWGAGVTVAIQFRWGDGSTETISVPTTVSKEVAPGVFRNFYEVLNKQHDYNSNGNRCQYTPEAILVLNGTACNFTSRKSATVWDRDNANGGQIRINPTIYRVCEGTSANVTFTDQSQFNCLPPLTFTNRNKIHRWTQWIYNTSNNGAYSASPRIPGILVNGVARPADYAGGVDVINSPVTGPNDVSEGIFVPATATVGQVYEVTLRNWNICNPYDADSTNGKTNPTDLVDGDFDPIRTNAIIVIVSAPTPDFDRRRGSFSNVGDLLEFCPDETIYFKNNTSVVSGGNYAYTWRFFDNGGTLLNTQTGTDVTHSFPAPGDYKVRLTVRDNNSVGSCETSVEKDIRIVAAPTVALSIGGNTTNPHEYCKQDRSTPVSLTVNGVIATASPFPSIDYFWTISRRNSSADSIITTSTNTIINTTNTSMPFSFDRPGVYRVRLTAKDNSTDCALNDSIRIVIYDRPNAVFTGSPVCAGQATTLSGISRETDDIPYKINGDRIVSWDWDFNNDGAFDLTRTDASDFNHDFPANPSIAGTYDVVLRVTTQHGCTDLVTRQIIVNPLPVPVISKSIGTATEICSGQSVTFTNTTATPPAIGSYTWRVLDNGGSVVKVVNNADLVQAFTNNNTTAEDYTIELTVTTTNNCTAVTTTPIRVHPVRPVFISSPNYFPWDLNCSPISVDFVHDADPATITSYSWEITNTVTGTTDIFTSGANPFNPDLPADKYFKNTTNAMLKYQVVLRISYLGGCPVTSNVLDIDVKPSPRADFTFTVDKNCSPSTATIQADLAPVPDVLYEFVFEDAFNVRLYNWKSTATDLDPNDDLPQVVFVNKGNADITKNITLTTSYNGCSQTVTRQITVKPQTDAQFDLLDNRALCSGESMQFEIKSAPSSIPATSYIWKWGDGSPDETVPAGTTVWPHTFYNYDSENLATYNVQLIAVDGSPNACSDISSFQTVKVEPYLRPNFEVVEYSNCSPAKFEFINRSQGPYQSNNVLWSVNTGTGFVNLPDHSDKVSYTFVNTTGAVQSYQVNMIIYSSILGSPPCTRDTTIILTVYPEIDLDFSYTSNKPLQACAPVNFSFTNTSTDVAGTTYNWDLNDGTRGIHNNVSFSQQIFHTFYNSTNDTVSYNVKLSAVTAQGCLYTTTKKLLIYPEVVADFSIDSIGCAPLVVDFYNTSRGAESYTWLDGLSQLPFNGFAPPTTVYPEGTYLVKLNAKSKYGCDSTITRTITAYPEPIPTFTVTPDLQYLPDNTVTIVNSTSGEWDWEWDFGDGTPFSYERNPPPHSYEGYGKFYITLKISNPYCSATETKTIGIYARKPIADFDPGEVTGCTPVTVNFVNKSLYADSTKYDWDFGDGKGRSTLVNPSYTYSEPGEFAVRLIARNFEGTLDDTVKVGMVKVYAIPNASFLARPIEIYLPDKPVYLTNQSLGAESYLWDFGDGNTSTESDPAHIYLDSGRYTITLIAYNKDGCSDTATVENAVRTIFGGRVLIPNAFTPNLAALGIGSSEDNDYFFPKAEGVVSLDMKIFNRWGEIMYHTRNKDDNGWNGYHNGKLCPQDVYVYTITMKFADGSVFNKTGDVVLLR